MIAAWKFQVAALLLLIQPKGDLDVLPADAVLIVARATGQCGDKGAERRAGRIGEIAPELARGICEAAGCVAGVEQQPRRLAGSRRQDHRSDARRVGKGWFHTGRSRWSPSHKKKNMRYQ